MNQMMVSFHFLRVQKGMKCPKPNVCIKVVPKKESAVKAISDGVAETRKESIREV